jgi:prophage antirepressor-like protein
MKVDKINSLLRMLQGNSAVTSLIISAMSAKKVASWVTMEVLTPPIIVTGSKSRDKQVHLQSTTPANRLSSIVEILAMQS